MPDYRRAYAPGGTFVFTLVTERRAPILCCDLGRRALRCAIQQTQARWPFELRAVVLLPDHLHTLWTLPRGDADVSRRWGFLKKRFVQLWLGTDGAEQAISASRVLRRSAARQTGLYRGS